MRPLQPCRDTKINLDNLTLPYDQRNLEATKAAALASSQLDVARKNYEPCKNKRESEWTSKEKSVCKNLQEKLEDARSYYRTAVRRIQYESELMVANAKLEDLLADYQNLQQGPDPDELKAIEARIKADEAALAQANATLDDLMVRAPFDGTVVNLNLIIGERVSAGQVIVQLADFSRWYVETDNLTELEVVKISAGQAVLITPDALPELQLKGTVERISNVFEEKRGDITYTARIILTDEDPRLRWGMTVLVSFINP